MASPCEVLIDGGGETRARHVAEAVAAEAWRIEAKFSRYRDDSVLGRINGTAGTTLELDEETANLIDFAANAHAISDGLFDISSGVLRRAWSFDGGTMTPREAEIAALLPLVGWHRASWQRPHLTLLPGMQIDLGGIGKEYAVDRAVDIATRLVSRAVLVNFGGDLAVSGARSGSTPWRVGVEAIAPELAAGPPIDLYAGGLATSGDTYRFVQAGTQRLPHILDPRSGRPVAGAPRSVTVAAASCTMAGMFATLAMLQGEHAERFLDEEGVQYRIQRSPAALV